MSSSAATTTRALLQASVISLQSDVPFLLGRRTVAVKKRVINITDINNLDEIATAALRAKALERSTKQQERSQQTGTPHWSEQIVRPPTQDARVYWPSPHHLREDGRGDLSKKNAGGVGGQGRGKDVVVVRK